MPLCEASRRRYDGAVSPPIAPTPLPVEFLRALRQRLSPTDVSEELAVRDTYGVDRTTRYFANPPVVVWPRTAQEVQAVVELCGDHRIAVVPSGGRTGLSGGAVAASGELVLSLERMNAVGAVDVVARTVRVEAGAVTQRVHEHCAPYGLWWPVDFASKGSSHVGGNIATNAGGIRVIRYGMTRAWVLGLEVVTGAGEFLSLNGRLEKNNSGYDLRQLFIGSEGTLGVVTAATLKLAPLPPPTAVALFSCTSLQSVLGVLAQVRRAPYPISAFEFFSDRCLVHVLRHHGLVRPLENASRYYALVEIEHPQPSQLTDWLGGLLTAPGCVDGTVALSDAQAHALWQYRERISESLSKSARVHKNDVAVPVARLVAFCDAVELMLKENYPDFELCLFGHLGDGNLHINVLQPRNVSDEEFVARTASVDDELYRLVRAMEGTVSAEHGVGLLKKAALATQQPPATLRIMAELKRVFDPRDILNPGKVFDAPAPSPAFRYGSS